MALSNAELSEKLIYWVRRLIESGGKAWTLCVPAQDDHDPDLVMMEAARRLAALSDGADSPTLARYYVKIKYAKPNNSDAIDRYIKKYQTIDNDFLRVEYSYIQNKGISFENPTEAQAVCNNLTSLCGDELDPQYQMNQIKLNAGGGGHLSKMVVYVSEEMPYPPRQS